jgi:hypothetical protein
MYISHAFFVIFFVEFDATPREATLIVEGKLAAIAAE